MGSQSRDNTADDLCKNLFGHRSKAKRLHASNQWDTSGRPTIFVRQIFFSPLPISLWFLPFIDSPVRPHMGLTERALALPIICLWQVIAR